MLGICYYRKAEELLTDMGQADYAVKLDTFTVEELWQKFQRLTVELPRAQQEIQQKVMNYIIALDKQYDKLL